MNKNRKQMIEKQKEYESYKKFMKTKRKRNSCHKTYPAYQSISEKRKGTVYESKLGGIPYISEGEKWVVCPKCNVEKVLILQLNVQELLEVSDTFREWDFIQIFACMKPSETLLEEVYEKFKYSDVYEDTVYEDDEHKEQELNERFYKIKAEDRCYNILERNPTYDPFYHELIDGKNMSVSEPFNSYFDIKLVKKDKAPQQFTSLPWIEGYNLYYDEEQNKIGSNIYNDKRTYNWVEGHLKYESIITSWKKVEDVECMYHSDYLNDICSTETHFEPFDFLGLLSSYSIDENLEALAYYKDKNFLDCPLCEKPLTLLFQFCVSGSRFDYDRPLMFLNDEDIDFAHQVYALFYCEKHPELISCHCVAYEH